MLEDTYEPSRASLVDTLNDCVAQMEDEDLLELGIKKLGWPDANVRAFFSACMENKLSSVDHESDFFKRWLLYANTLVGSTVAILETRPTSHPMPPKRYLATVEEVLPKTGLLRVVTDSGEDHLIAPDDLDLVPGQELFSCGQHRESVVDSPSYVKEEEAS